ncbi:hypothetical protein LWI28_016517 [Acer negundo]|uniref:BHLH domain-containing protein n=1 Tax=Acer negundo TaxID=4023 RepID=A0AAD5JL83_ACENE|nr:hypothetical protein LWI28_016517 [Acer negundo]KAK4854808.1 hypothetical protein QYF36_001532 [Acer negundo]
MDHFFQEQFLDDIFCNTPPVNQSAFVPYESQSENNVKDGCNPRNSNKRMIEFLRKNWCAGVGTQVPDRVRCQHHMFNERMRRLKEKQNYMALHALLPHRTKSDKNTIVQTAMKTIQQLHCNKKELERRNYQLVETKTGMDVGGGTKIIRVDIDNPISGIDSMAAVLKCLKKLGSRTRRIQSQFSHQKLSSVIDVETQIGGREVENAVHETLQEEERKLLSNYRES